MSISNNNTKTCIKCSDDKLLSEFGKDSHLKNGLLAKCKKCKNRENKNKSRTKNGLLVVIYNSQKLRSKKNNFNQPEYSLEDLRKWAFSQPIFHKLYDEWVKSGYQKMLVPSFDRTDDYQGYCLTRLNIMTWKENREKYHQDLINFINNKKRKPVAQEELNGAFIKNHISITEAGKSVGVTKTSIWRCCKGLVGSSAGYKWRYI